MKLQKMKALIWEGKGVLSLREVPVPEIEAHEVLIRVSYTGMCATDKEIVTGTFPTPPPYILGHEITGSIASVGGLIQNLKAGDRVVVDPAIPCQECPACHANRPEYCYVYREIGINENGGWAEFVKVPGRCVHRIPDEITDLSAAIFEPMTCPFGAVEAANVYPGDDVLIFGDGPAAFYFAQIVKLKGAGTISMVMKQLERISLFSSIGVNNFYFIEQMKDLASNAVVKEHNGFDLVIDAVGASETVKHTVTYAKTGGRIIFYGLKDASTDYFPHREVIFKNLTIYGKTNSPSIWPKAIQCVKQGDIVLEPLIEKIVKPEEVPGLLQQWEGKKAVIDWRSYSTWI